MPKTAVTRGTGKRVPLNMRTTQEVRDLLEYAAAQSGRSLVQEVEHRIQRSFEEQDEIERTAGAIYSSLGGPETYQLLRWLGDSIRLIEQGQGKRRGSWMRDVKVFADVKDALGRLLEFIEPKVASGRPTQQAIVDIAKKREAEHLGIDVANKVIDDWAYRALTITVLENMAMTNKEEQAQE